MKHNVFYEFTELLKLHYLRYALSLKHSFTQAKSFFSSKVSLERYNFQSPSVFTCYRYKTMKTGFSVKELPNHSFSFVFSSSFSFFSDVSGAFDELSYASIIRVTSS